MKFFWPIYLTVAAVGTTGVFVAAPLARPYVPEWLKISVSTVADAGRSVVAARIESADRTAVRAEPAPTDPVPVGQALPATQETQLEEMPPALHGIYLAQRGEKPGWGVTHQRTVYYTLDGTHAGHVEGGALLDFHGTRTSSKGGMVECILQEENIPATPMLVSVSDVYLFTGHYRKLSPRQRQDLKAYYALCGKIAARKKELLQLAADKNPFFTEYQAAYKRLMAHIETAKELSLKRDKASELEKMRIEDSLRQMKMAEAQLRKTYDAIHLKFRTWKEQHANEIAKPENDAQVQQWTQQRLALIPRVPGLAY